MNILVVDDEKEIAEAVKELLSMHNYSVTASHDPEEGVIYAESGNYDLIILDVMMPKIDGFTILKNIRAQKIDCPVLFLTAKSETADKIYGLDIGADDYICKPFNSDELLARIKALLRRKEKITSDILSFGDLSLDRDTLEIIKNEKKISLGKKEFQILETLMLNAGKNIDKEKLIEKIWGYDSNAEYNAIEVYISFLRRKISAINSSVIIKSTRGIGYSLGKNE